MNTKTSLVGVCSCCLFLLSMVEARADIRFEARPYPIRGLPPGFMVDTWAVMPHPVSGTACLVVTAGSYRGHIVRSKVLVVSLSEAEGSVVEEVFTTDTVLDPNSEDVLVCTVSGKGATGEPNTVLTVQPCSVYAVDYDNDGSDEVFITGRSPTSNRAYRRTNGKWNEMPVPYERLYSSRLTWADWNGDGYADLVLMGLQMVPGEKHRGSTVFKMYANNKGTLEPQEPPFKVPGSVSKAQAVDVNGDGKQDLIIFPASPGMDPEAVTHVYLNAGPNGLKEVEFPLLGRGQLFGVSGCAASGDIDGDGQPDLLVSGGWLSNVSKKAWLTILYAGFPKSKGDGITFRVSGLTDDIPDMPYFKIIDLDGDGDMDILGGISRVEGEVKRYVTILENRNHSLVLLPEPLKERAYGLKMIPIDINGDGLPDVLCFPSSSLDPVMLLLNVSSKGTSLDAK